MAAERVRWFGVVLIGLWLAVSPGCDKRRQVQDADPCRTLESPEARRVCETFSGALEQQTQDTADATHLVFRSYCDARAERVSVAVSQVDRALAEAIERRFRLGDPTGDCVYTTEFLTPRGQKTAWAAIEGLDEYHAQRDALVIKQDPVEVVTPLDFAVVRPEESTEVLRALPHIYRRQARNAEYFALDTPVQPHDVHTFVLRNRRVKSTRYHRVRHSEVTQETLTDAVGRAAAWFETMRDESKGRFYYEYDPYRDEHEGERYNLLRHAGSTWAIMQAYGLTGDEKTRKLGEHALGWIADHSRTEKKQGRTIRYVVEPWNNKAKLGGAGLWLLALSEHARLTGDTSKIELMQQIANYIYLAQDPETGQFASFHDADGLRMSDHVSDYYPGEAMFGLHRARPFLTDVPVCEITKKGLGHMLQKEPRQMPASKYRFVNQWNTYTVREYRRDCDDDQYDWVWRRDLEHMLTTTSTLADDPVMAGAYEQSNGDFSTSPTRLEALTTICAELGREDAGIARRCDPVVRRVAAMQLSFQHGPSNSWIWSNPDAVEGGFARELDRETIRIDFTQHHMSAMYNAVDFLRHVSPYKNQTDQKTAANTARSFPFNLVGETTCQPSGGSKCL